MSDLYLRSEKCAITAMFWPVFLLAATRLIACCDGEGEGTEKMGALVSSVANPSAVKCYHTDQF